MDILNSVREMRSPVDSDVSVARAALAGEMAGPRPARTRPRARVAMVAVGALAIGGIVAGNALGWSQPGSGGAEAAAAATLLNTAAVNVGEYDFPATDGQYIATTIVGSVSAVADSGSVRTPAAAVPYSSALAAACATSWSPKKAVASKPDCSVVTAADLSTG